MTESSAKTGRSSLLAQGYVDLLAKQELGRPGSRSSSLLDECYADVLLKGAGAVSRKNNNSSAKIQSNSNGKAVKRNTNSNNAHSNNRIQNRPMTADNAGSRIAHQGKMKSLNHPFRKINPQANQNNYVNLEHSEETSQSVTASVSEEWGTTGLTGLQHEGMHSNAVAQSDNFGGQNLEQQNDQSGKNSTISTNAKIVPMNADDSHSSNVSNVALFHEYYNSYMQQPIFQRLTNSCYYSGSSRERFDEYGRGRGAAGRQDIYHFDGLTESASRRHEVYSSAPSRPKTAPVRPQRNRDLHAKLIWVYRNGDGNDEGSRFFCRTYLRNMPQLYKELSASTKMCAREIYDQHLKKVTRLEEISDGGKYLVCEGGGPTKIKKRLDKFLSTWVTWE